MGHRVGEPTHIVIMLLRSFKSIYRSTSVSPSLCEEFGIVNLEVPVGMVSVASKILGGRETDREKRRGNGEKF